jgi:hypothetical protein
MAWPRMALFLVTALQPVAPPARAYRPAGRWPGRRTGAERPRRFAGHRTDGRPGTRGGCRHCRDLRRSGGRDGQDLAITAEYMNTRKQFGVAIASFQALRHRVADMKMQLELARSMSFYASLKLNEAPAERSLAMSAPRCNWASPCATWASRRCSCTAALRDRRVHREPLLQEADPDGNAVWRHAAPHGSCVGADGGDGGGVCLSRKIPIRAAWRWSERMKAGSLPASVVPPRSPHER